MTELKSSEAEEALREHVAAARGESPERGLLYHENVTELRRTLMNASVMYTKMGKPYSDQAFAWINARRAAEEAGQPEPPRPPQPVRDADMACMMAASYAYTLAAVLRLAGDLGPEVARKLATAADDILVNGDFEDLNADVTPQGEGAPQATQGLEIVVASPTASQPKDTR